MATKQTYNVEEKAREKEVALYKSTMLTRMLEATTLEAKKKVIEEFAPLYFKLFEKGKKK